jgi:hypothetical protein
VAYADVHGGKNVEKVKAELEKKAVSSLTAAAALPWQTLQDTHTEVGLLFGIFTDRVKGGMRKSSPSHPDPE